ncbi:ornithine cyclodeaminase [Rhizobiales bacterium GAS191]|jgi:ornithine cyclodeaminase/alanine dehydrogenase-like protein (mu-crystallin family)|nr:ornithine cyclodeaminase [Rhizobiales bacterium GAS113]SED45587.1 ornithine cyclodeaminase [Rhizobiales bacterium GAS188]SEE93021.1 ornithine cyclodeaminase [Rhizobiales bacterium GAS191]
MRVVTAAEIDAALSFPALIEALRRAFAAKLIAPERHHHLIERGEETATLLLMPAWTGSTGEPSYLATKLATVFPGNAARGRPSVYATTILLDGGTGEPLAAMDGTRLTLWRTAATSALAASYLARKDASRLTMVGAGALAPFLIRAHCAVRPIREVTIWNHNGARAREVVERMTAEPGFVPQIKVAESLETACREADIVSCATLTRSPLVRGDWLAAGAHLDLVGAYNLEMREADDTALRRARIFIDTQAALKEGGDVAVALRDGAIAAAQVRGDLAGLVGGGTEGRSGPSDITLFKSIGAAIEDLAAAVAVWEAV